MAYIGVISELKQQRHEGDGKEVYRNLLDNDIVVNKEKVTKIKTSNKWERV